MRLFGIVGWSGAGKTTLIERLIPLIQAQGVSVSTIKHAHHDLDLDRPGKDSFRHRQAGATEVMIATARRWVLLHEGRGATEPDVDRLAARMTPVDLILVEGFKAHGHPKIEVYRPVLGVPPHALADPSVLAIASDAAVPGGHIALDLDDPAGIARFILDRSDLNCG